MSRTNEWLSIQPLAWTLILDADVYLSHAFTLDWDKLDPQCLYSIPRRICSLE